MEYTGVNRTTLTKHEKECLKKAASVRGMTLVGYQDSILREAIRKETENAVRDKRD